LRVLIVDDHVLFREGLVGLLSQQPDITVIGQAGSVQAAVAKALELQPDLVLLDISLPDGSGLEAMNSILKSQPETKIVILTVHETSDFLLAAVRSGAKGYLLKNTPISRLVISLRALERGEAALSRRMFMQVMGEVKRLATMADPNQVGVPGLTHREQQVLELLGNKATNQEIALSLVISENTVKVHVRKILEKLKLVNRREASEYARRIGLVKINGEPVE
jgi:DNA-binding NarL/FixJ family response regulator